MLQITMKTTKHVLKEWCDYEFQLNDESVEKIIIAYPKPPQTSSRVQSLEVQIEITPMTEAESQHFMNFLLWIVNP